MTNDILSRLPAVRGRYAENAPLGAQGWFKCGGTAEVLFRPEDADDLIDFLKQTPHDIPVQVVGVLSNTIVRDRGVPGVTIRLGRSFAGIDLIPPMDSPPFQGGAGGGQFQDSGFDDLVPHPNPPPERGRGQTAHSLPIHLALGAAALDTNVAQFAADQGLTGLEFLHGIPGTIGGALRMNAGAVGAVPGTFFGQTSISDVLVRAVAIDRSGQIHHVVPSPVAPLGRHPLPQGEREEIGMSYRHTDAPDDWTFVSCVVRATFDPGGAAAVQARMQALKERRENAQPTREKTGGSTFANPSPDECAAAGLPEPMRAWQMIEAVGGRDLRVGGAHMSPKHLNFMINDGTATATDLETLGETLIARVREKFGVTLRWEIKRVGET
jgi:UDP-N-acetylmuramate dehydrogenase